MKKAIRRVISIVCVVILLVSGFIGYYPTEGIQAAESSNLKDFTTAASIDLGDGISKNPSTGAYVIKQGKECTVNLTFDEEATMGGKQFSDVMTYEFPEDFNAKDLGEQEAVIEGKTSNNEPYTLKGTYSVTNNVLTFKFDTSDTENYSKFAAANNADLSLNFKGVFENDVKRINWGGAGVTTDIEIDTSSGLTVAKTNAVAIDGKVTYTVTVTSSGNNDNVVINDLAGNLLSLTNVDKITVKDAAGNDIQADITAYNGSSQFSVKIPSMTDGQKAVITYYEQIDKTNAFYNGASNGNNQNTVTASSDQSVEKSTYNWVDVNKVVPSVDKNAQASATNTSTGKAEISYTIKINENKAEIPLGGKEIVDELTTNSAINSYAGDGVKLVKKDLDGNVVSEEMLTWQSLNVYKEYTKRFSYQVPQTDTVPYIYELTYKTLVDMSSQSTATKVENKATVGRVTGFGSATIGTVEGTTPKFAKSYTWASPEYIDWEVKVTVPVKGLENVSVLDLPDSSQGDILDADDRIDEAVSDKSLGKAVQVSGLVDGDSAAVIDSSDPANVKIKFDKLVGGSEERDVTIKIRTKNNFNNQYTDGHTNKATLTYGPGLTIDAQSTAYIKQRSVEKAFQGVKMVTENGVESPVFMFSVKLSQLSATQLKLTDTFDTENFEYYADGSYTYGTQGVDCGYIYGGTQWWHGDKATTKIEPTATATGFTISVPVYAADGVSNSEYVPFTSGKISEEYILVYGLKLKSGSDLNKLVKNGTISLDNKVNFFNVESTATGTYEYEKVRKGITSEPSGTNHNASWKIEANPSALQLSDTGIIDVTDQMSSNQTLDYDTVKIVNAADGSVIPDATFDMTGNTIKFTIPDQTHAIITYTTKITGIGDVEISNSAEIAGYKKTESGKYTLSATGGGSASVVSITIVKYKTGDVNTRLKDVEFELQYKDSDGNWASLSKHNKFVTDAEGKAVVSGDMQQFGWTLWEGTRFRLVETSTNTGYQLGEPVEFTISKNSRDAAQGILMPDDCLAISNNYVGEQSKIAIMKTDSTGTKALEGAHFQILDSEGKIVQLAGKNLEWDSTSVRYEIVGLPNNATYTLHETKAPNGYLIGSDKIFTIDEDGNLVTDNTDKTNLMVAADKTLLATNDETSVNITKTSLKTGKALAGAHLQVLDADGNIVEEWDSTTETHKIVGKLSVGQVYTLRESKSPLGFALTSDTKFTIGDDGKVVTGDLSKTTSKVTDGVVIVEDSETQVNIKKTDIANGNELAGAHIQVLDKDGKVVEEWDSTSQAHEISGKLSVGETYTLRETVAPKGYNLTSDTIFTIGNDGKVDASKTTTTSVVKDGIILVEDQAIETVVNIKKTDIATGAELAGAHIQVLDKDGKVVEEWDSTSTAHEVKGLTIGSTYTLREIVAPKGYNLTSDTRFTIGDDGKVDASKTTTTSKVKDGIILVEDQAIDAGVLIKKTDIATGAELAGAHIQVLDKDGKVVEEWDSTSTAHEVKGLTIGSTYTLRETVAPKGYNLTSDTRFTIGDDGKVDASKTTTTSVVKDGIILVEDQAIETVVNIKKTDIATGAELAGAHIQVLDKDGKVVEEWDSTSTAHEIKGKLEIGSTYTLRETVAPKGYNLTSDTRFTIGDDGKVDASKTTTTSVVKDGIILVEDQAIETVVNIKKTDIATGAELAGAHIQVLDKDGKVVEEWDSTSTAHEIKGKLEIGSTYTLRETVAPKGYNLTSDTRFTIGDDGKVDASKTTTTSVVKDGIILVEDQAIETVVNIKKTDIATGAELAGAHIQVLDKDGKVVEEWDSTNTAHEIKGKLEIGSTYTLRETVAPKGYNLTSDTRFTIGDDGKVDASKTTTTSVVKDGIILVEDQAIETVVNIKKTDIATGAELAGAHIQVLDKDGKVVEEWDSTNTAHEIKGKLEIGSTYTLRETVAPKGYNLTSDTRFTIGDDGKVDASKTTTTSVVKDGIILVEDQAIETVVNIKKTDIATGAELAGAHIQVLDKDGKVVEEWDSTSTAHEIKGKLEIGSTYTLRETVAPKGYNLTSDTRFTIGDDGKVDASKTTTTSVVKDGIILVEDQAIETVVNIKKTDIATGAELAGAHIQVLDKDGKVVEEWDSTSTAHEIKGKLEIGSTYTLRETVAPKGYNLTSDTRFTIGDDGKVDASKTTTTSVVKDGIIFVEDAIDTTTTPGKTTTTDIPGPETPEKPDTPTNPNTPGTPGTTTDTPDGPNTPNTPTTPSTPGTSINSGDTSNIMIYMALAALAFAGIVLTLVSKKKAK